MREPEGQVLEKLSFTWFVCPFRFDSSRLQSSPPGDVWSAGVVSQTASESAPADQLEVLPHIRRQLDAGAKTATVVAWQLGQTTIDQNFGSASRTVWRLLHKDHGRRSPTTWQCDFTVEGATLALFNDGIGFLSLRLRPHSTEPRDWCDFLHHFRYGVGRGVGVEVTRRSGPGPAVPWRPPLLAPVAAEPLEPYGLVTAVLATFRPEEYWWKHVFVPCRLIPYYGLLMEGTSPDQDASFLARLRKLFASRQNYTPAPESLSPSHRSLVPYASRCWHLMTLEGGGFVGRDVPDDGFYRGQLSRHLQDQYWLAFLLAMHSRFALLTLSADVAEHWPRQCGLEARVARAAVFEQLRDGLLEYTARSHFSQVFQRENPHAAHRRWVEICEIDALYREVRDEVAELHADLAARQQATLAEQARQAAAQAERQQQEQKEQAERLQRLVAAFGIILGGPTLVMGFLGINLRGVTTPNGVGWLPALGLAVFGAMAGWAAFRAFGPRRPVGVD